MTRPGLETVRFRHKIVLNRNLLFSQLGSICCGVFRCCCCFCFPSCLSRKGGGQALTPEHSAGTISFGSQQRALPNHLTPLSSPSATISIFRHRRELDYWGELLVNAGKRRVLSRSAVTQPSQRCRLHSTSAPCFFLLFCLQRVLSQMSSLAWNMPFTPGWPQTDGSASWSWGYGCAAMPVPTRPLYPSLMLDIELFHHTHNNIGLALKKKKNSRRHFYPPIHSISYLQFIVVRKLNRNSIFGTVVCLK